jgi:hypothetical protein
MSKPSQKKQLRRKAKETASQARRKVWENKKNALERAKLIVIRNHAGRYPEFHVWPQNAPKGFVEAVVQAVRTIDFEDKGTFKPIGQKLFKSIKELGADRVLRDLEEACREQNDHFPYHNVITSLGILAFSRIPKEKLLKYIPACDFQIVPNQDTLLVICRALLRTNRPGGTIYYSKHKPTLTINGEEKIVGFSTEVIMEKGKRLLGAWETYCGLGDLCAFFHDCIYFERADLPDGQLAFTFYEECVPGYFSSLYASQVLGVDVKERARYYYRVGYAPAVIIGEFVKAKTILLPGFRRKPTPEYQLIEASSLSREDKERMKKQATADDAYENLIRTRDFSVIKWFHDNGIPQVIETDQPLYEPPL